jgi:phage I-like protein
LQSSAKLDIVRLVNVERRNRLVLLGAPRRSLATLGARTIDIQIVGDEPPTTFRLFKAGENETTKGVFLFDDAAAKLVMEKAAAHGVDHMVDLEHLSLDPECVNYDPDARAWLNLEVRNGELWAVNVSWTEDGASRLTKKKQRYISPAFTTDDDNRVTEIVNIALTAMPATHGTPALVAANRRQKPMSLKERIALLSARLSIAQKKIAKLADDAGGDAPAGKAATVKAAAEKASAALDELQKSFGGGDIDATFAAMDAAKSAMDECENAISAMTAGAAAPAAPDAGAPPADASALAAEKAQQMARKDAEIVTLKNALAKREHDESVAELAREMDERRALVGELVKLGRETPATAWADETATTPRGSLATMPLTELRDRVKAFGGSKVTLGGPRAPSGQVELGDGPEVSEAEAVYVKARLGMLASQGAKLRSFDDTMIRYLAAKTRQVADARAKNEGQRVRELTAPLRSDVIALARNAGLVALASTPVTPIQEFGASSQIALQSFRLEYNVSLASMPAAWAETIGHMLSDGSLKVTFPISYDATEYQEKQAPNAAANQPLSFDIEVSQREFFGAKQVELRRLTKGDFAYVQRWAQSAAEMARARVFLRNKLVTSLLENGTTGYWGSSATLATGIDGQPFWSATHKINPADASRKLRTVATFSNYQVTASPLNAGNLTVEKNQSLQVAAPDGRELGIVFDGILYPSALEQTAANLLKVQDLILDASTSTKGVSNVFAATRNPHFNSGLEMTRAMDLAGSAVTADYYLYSREGIARGLPPWVICEDPTEELRLWDESSDFFKGSGNIKIESHVFLNAVLAFPHCIRLIKGA